MAMELDKWLDISDEQWREYIFKDFVLRVEKPKFLRITNSSLGGHAHRIQTEASLGYYVAPGWKAIRWAVAQGEPVFKF